MKRRSSLLKKYLMFRLVPYFEPVNGEAFNPGATIKLGLKTMTLCRPREARFIGERVLRIIQEIPKERSKNEYWIKDALDKEAHRMFDELNPKEIIIEIIYE